MKQTPKIQESTSLAFVAGVQMGLEFALRDLRMQLCPEDRLSDIRMQLEGAKTILRKLAGQHAPSASAGMPHQVAASPPASTESER